MEPAWLKVNGGNFSLVEYQDKKGQLRPCYSLTKTECLYIATNDEVHAKFVLLRGCRQLLKIWNLRGRKSLSPDLDSVTYKDFTGRTLPCYAQTKHVMAIGQRRTREGTAYHSALGRKYEERWMPIDRQRDNVVEGYSRRVEIVIRDV